MLQHEFFGIRWDGPVGWLQQGDGGRNALGLNVNCPFDAPTWKCPHRINLDAKRPTAPEWSRFLELLEDPLVQGFLPLPRAPQDRALLFSDPEDRLLPWLQLLSRLGSPTQPTLQPYWLWKSTDFKEQLKLTNLLPWTLTQVGTASQKTVQRLLKTSAYLPRTIILMGSPHLVLTGNLRRHETRLMDLPLKDFQELPFEALGAEIVRRHLRKEDLHGST